MEGAVIRCCHCCGGASRGAVVGETRRWRGDVELLGLKAS